MCLESELLSGEMYRQYQERTERTSGKLRYQDISLGHIPLGHILPDISSSRTIPPPFLNGK